MLASTAMLPVLFCALPFCAFTYGACRLALAGYRAIAR